MKQRGRKSLASLDPELKVIQGDFGGLRPDAPGNLTPRQAEIWVSIVKDEPIDRFNTAELQNQLADLCIARDSLERAYVTLNQFEDAWLKSGKGLKRWTDYQGVIDSLVRRCTALARSLRLTNQSRYMPETAARQSANKGSRLWEWDPPFK